MAEWQTVQWGDLTALEYGKALRDYRDSKGQYRVFGTNGPIGWHDEAVCQHPTVIIGRKGAYRGIHYSQEPCAVIDTAFYLKPISDFDMKWAYYELLTHDINGLDSGSAIPSTTRDAFYHLPVKVPPLSTQRAIARILGSLDDLIDLNRQTNETLEQIARALFRHYFPYSPEDDLPQGWRVGTIGDIAENPRSGVDSDDITDDTPYIGLEHMPRHCIALSEWGYAAGLASNKFRFLKGDILFGKLRPYFHKVGIAPLDGVCSTDILVVRSKQPDWFVFLLAQISSDVFISHTDGSSTGTKMPRTNWTDMARFTIAMPPETLAAEYSRQVQPMLETIITNIHGSRTLSALRDLLLPKLLSGEIRVPTKISRVAD